jgi:nicotinamidase-related amidase
MRRALAIGVLLSALPVSLCVDDPKKLDVPIFISVAKKVQVEVKDPATGEKKIETTTVMVRESVVIAIDPSKTAVVVCDMWDDHWCKAAASRCGELAKAAEPVLKACRDHGMTIIHCPSDCMEFYKDHPARKRMLQVPKSDPPKGKDIFKDRPEPPLPVDDSDGGCDDDKPAKQQRAWTRQNTAITIDGDKDYISDNGNEVYSLMVSKKLEKLLVIGVHTNMCVLNRGFAIKQMVKWGQQVYLVRDLTDAMYNPKMKPFVSHEKGTELIIQFIEQYWCPTIESKSLLKAK